MRLMVFGDDGMSSLMLLRFSYEEWVLIRFQQN